VLCYPRFLQAKDIKVVQVHKEEELKVSQSANVHTTHCNSLCLPAFYKLGFVVRHASGSV
jgi:hypothetical protein